MGVIMKSDQIMSHHGSDSEYYSKTSNKSAGRGFVDSEDEIAFSRNKSRSIGSRNSAAKRADSDVEIPRQKKKESKLSSSAKRTAVESDGETPRAKKKLVPKRKCSAVKKPGEEWRVIDSESEDEEVIKRSKNALQSSYSKRVADGTVRRTAKLNGDLFVELKLYQVADIRHVDVRKRYEKAVLSLKYQADHNAPELQLLQQFLKKCKPKFGTEGYFFADKDVKE
ncbi:uncharacterized protein LOC126370404 [Pectinophora gossypiella]|uniref:uncharacterized protein LOC126370404 n=1 Tax=Pectinophora gossypiella TaxID=13191 RepID=UPI00214E931E|nr:uncharacterized protein LOC126370404 [Pectinophora gossypiella]